MKELVQYGMAGVLMSVVVGMAWFLLSKTMSFRESDLSWHREDAASKRKDFLVALARQQEAFSAVLTRMEVTWTSAMEKLVGQLGDLQDSVAVLLRRELQGQNRDEG